MTNADELLYYSTWTRNRNSALLPEVDLTAENVEGSLISTDIDKYGEQWTMEFNRFL